MKADGRDGGERKNSNKNLEWFNMRMSLSGRDEKNYRKGKSNGSIHNGLFFIGVELYLLNLLLIHTFTHCFCDTFVYSDIGLCM